MPAEEPKYRQYLHDLFRSGMLYDSSENRLDDYANMHKIQQLFRTNTWRSWRTAGLPGGLRTWSWIQDALKENNGPTLAWIAGPAGAYTAKDHHFHSGQKIEKQIVLINDTRQPQHFTATWTATVGGKEVGRGTEHGSLAVSEIRFIPIQVIAPAEEAGGKADGQITLTAAYRRDHASGHVCVSRLWRGPAGRRRDRCRRSGRHGQQDAGEPGLYDPCLEWRGGAPGGYRTQCLEGRPGGGGQAGGLCAGGRPGGDLRARPAVDGTGPRVAGVPAGQPARLPHEFPAHPRDRCRRPARLDGQQHPDRGLPGIRGKLPQGERRRSALRRLALGQPRRGHQRRHREAPPQRLASPAGMRVRPGLYAADGVGLRQRTADRLHPGPGRPRGPGSRGAAHGRAHHGLRASLPAVSTGEQGRISRRRERVRHGWTGSG